MTTVFAQSDAIDTLTLLSNMVQKALDDNPALAGILAARHWWRANQAADGIAAQHPFLTKRELREIRKAKLKADPSCAYCGEPVTLATGTLDHITPKNRGGRDIRENLCLSCPRCNSEKSDKTPAQFAALLQAQRDHFQTRLDRLSALVDAGHFATN